MLSSDHARRRRCVRHRARVSGGTAERSRTRHALALVHQHPRTPIPSTCLPSGLSLLAPRRYSQLKSQIDSLKLEIEKLLI